VLLHAVPTSLGKRDETTFFGAEYEGDMSLRAFLGIPIWVISLYEVNMGLDLQDRSGEFNVVLYCSWNAAQARGPGVLVHLIE